MATIADVARAAGVSIATVSRVLSPGQVPHPVRADTADRVRAAARQLRFVPSPLARGLAIRRSSLIGLIVPDLSDPHYPNIASGVEHRARQLDMAVLICNTLGEDARMADYVMLLQARRVDAVVLSGGASLTADDLAALSTIEVPLVLIGRPAVDVPWPYVSIDNVDGALQATRHLLAAGFSRIVHLGGPHSQTTMADRAQGYFAAMADAAVAHAALAESAEANAATADAAIAYAALPESAEANDAMADDATADATTTDAAMTQRAMADVLAHGAMAESATANDAKAETAMANTSMAGTAMDHRAIAHGVMAAAAMANAPVGESAMTNAAMGESAMANAAMGKNAMAIAVSAMARAAGAEVVETDGTPDHGYQQLSRRLDREPPVQAVFAATDRLAIAALALAADRGLHVPRELAVIGFDDLALAAQLRPSLSTMAQPAHQLGMLAIDLARRLLANDPDDRIAPVTLQATLAARESTLGPGGRYVKSP